MAKFKKADLQEVVDDGCETLEKTRDTITGKRRWSIDHDLVFREKATGRFFYVRYSEGATEYQHESPFEYEDDEIEAVEVHPVERTVTLYEEK
jgi:hypothetical protein